MKSIIAGGAGFIGSHLCETLVKKKHNVLCVDNLLTGRQKNIEHLLDDEHFEFINQDITKDPPPSMKKNIQYIFDFASPASPVDYLKYPIKTMRVGSIGTENLLRIAKENNARFFLASTSEVYGDPEKHPQPEEYWGNVNSIGPRSVYDEAKRYAEAITMAYHREFGVDIRIARIFNTYGPRMKYDDGRAVPNFIKQALDNKPITVYGDGSQTRSFCYIEDEVRGLLQLLYAEYTLPVNIGNESERTIMDVAKRIKKETNSDSEIIFKELPKDDPKVRRPDISRAKEILGWEPTISFNDGIRKTIQWFKDEETA